MSTDELLEAIRRPDEPSAREALAELVRRYGRYVFAVTLRFCGGNRHQAEDAFQTAFLRFLEAWTQRRFSDPIRSFPSLLLRMARNAAVDAARSRETAALPEIPVEVYVDLERRMTIDALLDRLPPDQRQVLLKTVIEGLDSQRAAEALGISPEMVRARKSRAIKRLRSLLEPEERRWRNVSDYQGPAGHK